MKLMRLLIVPAVALGLLALSAWAVDMPDREFPNDWYWGKAEQQAKHAAMEGKPAPELVLSDWKNGEVTAEDMDGKIVVVDFWATWCGPCLAAVPHNNEIAEKYAEEGVIVIGVCGSSSGQEKMEATAEKHNMQYPIAKDATQQSAENWSVMWWPTYGVIDRSGKLRALGLKPHSVDKVIDKLLEAEADAEQTAAAE
ncbi:MAG: redoxin domain-containing protein [Planctomycetes bacterium]|jgi:thiol-disulfide isomerase/thioredoxin|nr:redoxin domain-containing protein [Planctomycetota bacterium]